MANGCHSRFGEARNKKPPSPLRVPMVKMSSLILHCNIIYPLAIHKSNMKSQVHSSMSKSFKHKIDTRWTNRVGRIFSYRLFPSTVLTWLEPLNWGDIDKELTLSEQEFTQVLQNSKCPGDLRKEKKGPISWSQSAVTSMYTPLKNLMNHHSRSLSAPHLL